MPVADVLEPTAFAAALQRYLEAEHATQQRAVVLTQDLTAALVACDQARIEAASAALTEWEFAHREIMAEGEHLADAWNDRGGQPGFSVSQVLAWLQATGDTGDQGWRLGEAAGQLREVADQLEGQTTLNQLLIEQHAEVLNFTFLALAHAVQGTTPETAYDASGVPRDQAVGAALLDARG